MRQKHGSIEAKKTRDALCEPMLDGRMKTSVWYTPDEIEHIKQLRERLMKKGMTDKAIAREAAAMLPGRSAGSIREKIRKMLNDNELEPNPNRPKQYEDAEARLILALREGFMREGMNDATVSEKISSLTGRTKKGVEHKIMMLVRRGEACENPHNREKKAVGDAEMEALAGIRQEGIANGLTDKEIAIQAAKILGRPIITLDTKLRKMVAAGLISENPSKRNRRIFNDDEVSGIIRRREELILAGMGDEAISKVIGRETGRTMMSIRSKFTELLKERRIVPNPNKKGLHAPESDVLGGLIDALDVYTAGKTDGK
jgi:hypothetical protein